MRESLCFVIKPQLFERYFGTCALEKLLEFFHGISCSDILNIPLILQPPTNYIRKLIDRHFTRLDVIPRATFESNDSEMIFNMCLTGCGAALLPEASLFLPAGQDLQNIYIFPLKGVYLTSVISYPMDLDLPRYERTFIDVCKQVFSAGSRKIEHRKQIYFSQYLNSRDGMPLSLMS